MRLVKILSCLPFAFSCTANGDIYQWADGDNDGSIWLSSSIPEPFSDLSGQVLWWAELPNASLHHANASFANFSYANLSGANLSAANLSHANLFDANLENTDLAFTNFFGADLQFSNLNNANMFHADFSGADLSNIQNWDSAFWMAAKYNSDTIFPNGMDPNRLLMIEVAIPAPASLLLLSAGLLIGRKNYRL